MCENVSIETCASNLTCAFLCTCFVWLLLLVIATCAVIIWLDALNPMNTKSSQTTQRGPSTLFFKRGTFVLSHLHEFFLAIHRQLNKFPTH